MNKSSLDQILSDLEEIEKAAKGSLEEKTIRDHCAAIRYELSYNQK